LLLSGAFDGALLTAAGALLGALLAAAFPPAAAAGYFGRSFSGLC